MKATNRRQQNAARPRAQSRIRRLAPNQRRGIAAVEFAVIAPVFFILLIGIVEFGRMLMVQQVLTNASREGARRAVQEEATAAEVKQLVRDYLTNASISSSAAKIEVSPAGLNSVALGDDVTVSLAVSFNDVSWIPSPWFLDGVSLTASSVMSGERPN